MMMMMMRTRFFNNLIKIQVSNANTLMSDYLQVCQTDRWLDEGRHPALDRIELLAGEHTLGAFQGVLLQRLADDVSQIEF